MSTLNFIGLKRPGRGAVQLMPTLGSTLKKEQRYNLCTMSTFNFMGLKRPGLGADKLMPSKFTTLMKEQRYTFAVQ
jgi:hypothetical protein